VSRPETRSSFRETGQVSPDSPLSVTFGRALDRFTVELSVYVRADQRGRGIGNALMTPLIERAVSMRKHVMVAGVDAGNEGSLRFH
jgi:L-amino acid N-acyltransferase YncA